MLTLTSQTNHTTTATTATTTTTTTTTKHNNTYTSTKLPQPAVADFRIRAGD